MMTRAHELVQEMRICAVHLRVLDSGLKHIDAEFENDLDSGGDLDVLSRTSNRLHEQMADCVAEMVLLFNEAERIGLMEALRATAQNLGVEGA